MKQEKIVSEIFKKYKFREPINEVIQKDILIYKKEALIKIFKKNNKYSLFAFAIISIFLGLQRLGITTTITKSIIIFAIASVVTIASISSVSYYAIKNLTIQENINDKTITSTKINNIVETQIKRKTIKVEYKLLILPFKTDNQNKKIANKISSKIMQNLAMLKGTNEIKIIKNKNTKLYSKKKLIGALVKPVDEYLLTIKLVDENAKVIYFKKERFSSEKEIDSILNKVSLQISNFL